MQTEFFSRICRRAAHHCIKNKSVLNITTTHGARERETRQRQPRFLAPAAIQFSPSSWMSRRAMDGCRATPQKVRALGSFHSCQAIKAKRESKPSEAAGEDESTSPRATCPLVVKYLGTRPCAGSPTRLALKRDSRKEGDRKFRLPGHRACKSHRPAVRA